MKKKNKKQFLKHKFFKYRAYMPVQLLYFLNFACKKYTFFYK